MPKRPDIQQAVQARWRVLQLLASDILEVGKRSIKPWIMPMLIARDMYYIMHACMYVYYMYYTQSRFVPFEMLLIFASYPVQFGSDW